MNALHSRAVALTLVRHARPNLSHRLGRDVSLSDEKDKGREGSPRWTQWQLDLVALERAAAEQESLIRGYQREAERQERRHKDKEERMKEDARRLERERCVPLL